MGKSTIVFVDARQVFSDRGHPGIEAIVKTESGASGVAICTAGVSVGTHEIEFAYDGGTKWGGKGVMRAVNAVKEKIAPILIGLDAADQQAVDQAMLDVGKDILGGNATAAVSAANLKAGANALGIPLYRHIGGQRATTLPVPGVGFFSGKRRYNEGPKTNKPSHSFLAYDFASFEEASYALWELNQRWNKVVNEKFGLGDSRFGFYDLPNGTIKSDSEVWDLATENIIKCGYEGKVGMQVDVASDSYYDHKTGLYSGLFNAEVRDRDQQIEFLCNMVKNYPFICLEDPLYEDDYEGTAILTKKVDIQIVGDDLFTTNPDRVREGIKAGAANTVLLKVNQIGTISESLDMIQLAYDNGYAVMPCSSRGEGVDIVDYTVGINSGTVRESGLWAPGNRFLQIEKELGKRARFAGKHGLQGSRFAIK